MAFVDLDEAFASEVVWWGWDIWVWKNGECQWLCMRMLGQRWRWMRGKARLLMLELGCTRAQFSAHCFLEALSREFREGLPIQLLDEDNQFWFPSSSDFGYKGIFIGECEELEGGDEKKGLRVNTGKTNVMWCRLSTGQAEDSGEYPCGVFPSRSAWSLVLVRWPAEKRHVIISIHWIWNTVKVSTTWADMVCLKNDWLLIARDGICRTQ